MARRKLLPTPQLAWLLAHNRRRRGGSDPSDPTDPTDPEQPGNNDSTPYVSEFYLLNANLGPEPVTPITSQTHLANINL